MRSPKAQTVVAQSCSLRRGLDHWRNPSFGHCAQLLCFGLRARRSRAFFALLFERFFDPLALAFGKPTPFGFGAAPRNSEPHLAILTNGECNAPCATAAYYLQPKVLHQSLAQKRWRTVSKSRTAAAAETLRLSIAPTIGIATCWSQIFRTSFEIPISSEPITIAVGFVRSAL